MGLRELKREVRELRRANSVGQLRPAGSATGARAARRRSARSVRRGRVRRRRALLVLAVVTLIVPALIESGLLRSSRSLTLPSRAELAGLSLPQRIVAIAESQVGYHTEPANSYCNRFSAYWNAGSENCPAGETSEEWCADFAAWAWQQAGVELSYGYAPGELNGGAASFYEWGIAHGTWHPASSGYRPAPGDVAIYGLSLVAQPSAAHVAIVTGEQPGQQGPDVINGDGDRTGFSVVDTGTDQLRADTAHRGSALLTGYVSP